MDMIKMLPQEIENHIFYMVAEHPCARIIKQRRHEISMKEYFYKKRPQLLIDNFNKLHFDVGCIKLRLYKHLFNKVYTEYNNDKRKLHCFYSNRYWVLTQ
jgi:hypothetical protein